MAATEVRDLINSNTQYLFDDYLQEAKPLTEKIKPMTPRKAESLFLNRFFDLIQGFE